MSRESIETYLAEHRDRHADELCDWLRIPSISSVSDHDADTRRAAEWLVEKFRELSLIHI